MQLAELLDTLFLLLRKSPVILLHWYHHATVLLYCWHAYSVRIGTGLWFAAMNYSVHALMYFCETRPRSKEFPTRSAPYFRTLAMCFWRPTGRRCRRTANIRAMTT